MALRDQALEFARNTVATAVGEIVDAAQQAQAERRANPHRWSLFHAEMARRLPRWRWAARILHHRRLARRFGALAWADDQLVRGCPSSKLARHLGLPR